MKYKKTLIRLSKYSKLTPGLILAAFKKNENLEVNITSKDLGRPGFEIITDEGLCFITEHPISYYNKKWGRITWTQERVIQLALPIPLHLGEGKIHNDIFKISTSDRPKIQADYWLNEIFCPEIAATYFNKYFSKSDSLKEYRTIIFEALEAYYLGMDHLAIMSLIPVFEAGLRNIQNSKLDIEPNNVSGEHFEQHLKEITLQWGRRKLDKYVWYPGKDHNLDIEIDFLTHICPQSDVINAFRIYFKNVLYKPSYGTTDGFNRHIIMHLLKNDFKNPANFPRIFICLTHITFIESLENKDVPFFWPGIDPKDLEVAEYLIKISKALGDYRRPAIGLLGIGDY